MSRALRAASHDRHAAAPQCPPSNPQPPTRPTQYPGCGRASSEEERNEASFFNTPLSFYSFVPSLSWQTVVLRHEKLRSYSPAARVDSPWKENRQENIVLMSCPGKHCVLSLSW